MQWTSPNCHKLPVLNEASALFTHVRDEGHNIDWTNAKDICFISDVQKHFRILLIKSTFSENLNLSLGLYNLDKFIFTCILNHFKIDL